MKSFAVLAAATLAAASPIAKREAGGILLCTGANATGTCNHSVYPLDTCVNITTPFLGNTNTFAPDGEAFACYPYGMPCGGICTSPEGCTLGAIDFDYEHKYNLSAVSWAGVASFRCFTKTTTTTVETEEQ
ncbi:hypothetical protein SPBR_01100 [Sporothrix brasiliensis 5110]|uniref:Small secreted protein n=1 Tax=Sporothrix brasiliensis 5110 TaxID=1398154 RepID=A0A0C2ING4_9PEZI|nr:uncharacterized protein SPBR_01100 [Sporothrix brasiliensis 5110]KIH90576.1 hypothetical protein SPBR_01100 [Sporothrix brasiliensis 5110]